MKGSVTPLESLHPATFGKDFEKNRPCTLAGTSTKQYCTEGALRVFSQ